MKLLGIAIVSAVMFATMGSGFAFANTWNKAELKKDIQAKVKRQGERVLNLSREIRKDINTRDGLTRDLAKAKVEKKAITNRMAPMNVAGPNYAAEGKKLNANSLTRRDLKNRIANVQSSISGKRPQLERAQKLLNQRQTQLKSLKASGIQMGVKNQNVTSQRRAPTAKRHSVRLK